MSATQICNQALGLIGESPIVSVDDTAEKAARVCKAHFAAARDEALAVARWSFAKKQVALSKLSEVPLFKWNAAFQLPADFIRLCEIEGASAWTPREFFDVHGRKLVMNFPEHEDEAAGEVRIEYIRREEDVTLYSPLFCEAVACKLAVKIALPLTKSDAKRKGALQEFEQVVLPRCMTVDAQQRYSGENHPLRQMMGRSPLIRSRR